MRTVDPLWGSPQAHECVAREQPGALVRLGRRRLRWRREELGRRNGYSASTVSRLETGPAADLRLLRAAAQEVGVPDGLLGAALGLTGCATARVAATGHGPYDEEDPMRRRSLLAAAGVAAPVHLLASVDDALAAVPDPTEAPVALQAHLARSRALLMRAAIRWCWKTFPLCSRMPTRPRGRGPSWGMGSCRCAMAWRRRC